MTCIRVTGYADRSGRQRQERPPLTTARLDAAPFAHLSRLTNAASDYLSWLDRFEPHPQLTGHPK